MAKNKVKYNKSSLAESLKYYLDNTGAMVTYEALTTDSGFKKPEEISKALSERIADHILKDIQSALVSGGSVYFPEIGFIEIRTLKAGRRFNSIHTGEVLTTTKPTVKIKARPSHELFALLNPETPENEQTS